MWLSCGNVELRYCKPGVATDRLISVALLLSWSFGNLTPLQPIHYTKIASMSNQWHNTHLQLPETTINQDTLRFECDDMPGAPTNLCFLPTVLRRACRCSKLRSLVHTTLLDLVPRNSRIRTYGLVECRLGMVVLCRSSTYIWQNKHKLCLLHKSAVFH